MWQFISKTTWCECRRGAALEGGGCRAGHWGHHYAALYNHHPHHLHCLGLQLICCSSYFPTSPSDSDMYWALHSVFLTTCRIFSSGILRATNRGRSCVMPFDCINISLLMTIPASIEALLEYMAWLAPTKATHMAWLLLIFIFIQESHWPRVTKRIVYKKGSLIARSHKSFQMEEY